MKMKKQKVKKKEMKKQKIEKKKMRMKIMKMKMKKKNEENEDYEDEDEYENEDDYDDDDDDDDDETMNQDKKNEIIIQKKDILDKIIDKSKSFEEQIKSLKKLEDLKWYWSYKNFGDKELNFKNFKIELADKSNIIDENVFEQIFGHALIKLVDKLINTIDKEENQIIVKNIKKSKDKLFKEEKIRPYDFVIQPQQRSDLKYTIDLILDFNKTIQLDLV